MKQLTALMMVSLLIFASCQKEKELTNVKDISYAESDFLDNEVIDPSANKNGARKSNLKVIIRQVNNATNTYRLVLKVDSVSVGVDGEGNEKLVPMADDAIVNAGLSVPDPNNPDLDQYIFLKNGLQFRKQNENGYYVYVSDAFVTTANFDFELVGVNYIFKFNHNGNAIQVDDKSDFFILPNGKSIEQDPKLVKSKAKGLPLSLPGVYGSYDKYAARIDVTIADDPTSAVAQVVYKGVLFGLNNTKKEKEVPISAVLERTASNSNLGVTKWTTIDCVSFLNENNNKWTCEDEIESVYTDLRESKGTIYLIDGNGRTIGTYIEDDLFSKRNLEK